MKKLILKNLALLGFLLLTVYVAVGLSFQMPQADILISEPKPNEKLVIERNSFTSSVKLQFSNPGNYEGLVGNSIHVSGNDYIDEIRIGITDYQTSVIELWNKGSLVEGAEKGFKNGFKSNKSYSLFLDFDNNSKIHLRVRDAVFGAFNEVAENGFDYSSYADELSITNIQLLDQGAALVFSDFQLWGDWDRDKHD